MGRALKAEGRRPGMGAPGAGRRPLEHGWARDERKYPPHTTTSSSRMSWREPKLQPAPRSSVSPFAV